MDQRAASRSEGGSSGRAAPCGALHQPSLCGTVDPSSSVPDDATAAAAECRSELALIARSLRAHVELLDASGAWGLRRSMEPAAPALRRATETRSARAPMPALVAPPPAASAEEVPPGAAAPAAAAEARLEVLAREASVCTRCPLHQGRTRSVFARGSGVSGLAFVGEGPGEEEDRQGLPFVGPAGQLLDRMIAAMQLGRDDVYVCNIVKCRPPRNRKPEADEMAQCMPFLTEQLEVMRPRVIVALGATAVQGLLGTTEGITRLRGQWKLYRGRIPVMPTFHPAYLLRQPQAKREVWRDLQEVLRQLQKAGGAGPAA